MVARIKIGRSLRNGFYYNENKVKEGVAECLMAANYPFRLERINTEQKLKVLQKIASLRPNLKANSVHISLNFDPSENLSSSRLKAIADSYMEQIGFGAQPYLVYQHFDSGHPHIHIVSTKVNYSGGVVDTNYIALKKSEPARKEIERTFNLIKAEDQQAKKHEIKNAYAQKIVYGKTESKKAISSVLAQVVDHYQFTSLAELNTVLELYNVRANRGTDKSVTYRNNGLSYHILDNNGKPVGVPIKASALYNKPTLKNLEAKFQQGEVKRVPHKARIKNAIDLLLLKQKYALKELITALEKQGIDVVLRKNSEGTMYGITYIDHQTKCVFNGSALGKPYSAKAMLERCTAPIVSVPDSLSPYTTQKHNTKKKTSATVDAKSLNTESDAIKSNNDKNLIDLLMQPEQSSDFVPRELRRKRRKKKKKL